MSKLFLVTLNMNLVSKTLGYIEFELKEAIKVSYASIQFPPGNPSIYLSSRTGDVIYMDIYSVA